MNYTFLRGALVAAAISLAPVPAVEAADISGAGATFPYPIYAKWADVYKKDTGVGLNYQSIGSGGGIKQIKAKTVTFGASDMPLKPEELVKDGLVQFPTVIGGVVPVINLPGVGSGELTLDIARDVEAAFGGDFLTALGNERRLMREHTAGDVDHGVGAGHLEVELHAAGGAEEIDVTVDDVTAVFAKVGGNALRAAEDTLEGGVDDVGLAVAGGAAGPRAVAGLADGGDVIDVEAEVGHGGIVRGSVRWQRRS